MKANITQIIKLENRCMGCGACYNICPVDAINMTNDKNGYYVPSVNENKCILCGKCVEVCPFFNNRSNLHFHRDNVTVYAAWAPPEVREKCSSGGVASIFSKCFMEQGGTVFGAVWNDDFSCSIVAATTEDVCNKQRYSKYLQSNVELTFRDVKKKLSKGQKILYFGVPCQIAGLNSFLGNSAENENLITVDIVCSHAPSSQLFKKYIDEKSMDIQSVDFRSKNDFGWTCDGHVIQYKDGSKEKCTISTDSYQAAYHSLVMRKKICEECLYADFPRQGDITIGDFWGIGCEDPTWDDGKGTSLVIANSDKGLSFVEIVKECFYRIQKVPIQWALNKGNRIGKDGRKGHKNSPYFYRMVWNNTFENAVNNALYDKHDIGLVCYSNRNYGNNLTNYALYFYLNKLGYTVLMINTPKDSFFVWVQINCFVIASLKEWDIVHY